MFASARSSVLRVFRNTNQYLVVFDEPVVSCAILNASIECSPLGFSVFIGDNIPSTLSLLHLIVTFDGGAEHLVSVRISHIDSLSAPISIYATCVQGDLTFPSVLIGGGEPIVSSDFVLSVSAGESSTIRPSQFKCRCNIIGEDSIPLQYTSTNLRRTFNFLEVPSAIYGTIDLLMDSYVVWRFSVIFNQ